MKTITSVSLAERLKMNKFKYWFRAWLGLDKVVLDLSARVATVEKENAKLSALIKVRTEVGIAIGFRNTDQVICVGRFQGVDYIQAFSVSNREFAETVQMMKQIRKAANIRWVDSPPSFRAVVNREM